MDIILPIHKILVFQSPPDGTSLWRCCRTSSVANSAKYQSKTFWIHYLLLSVWRSTSYKLSKGHKSHCPFVLGCTLITRCSIWRRLRYIFTFHSMKA